MKKIINITAEMLRVDNTDDMVTIESSFNSKRLRLCANRDFERVGLKEYYKPADNITEHCLDNYNDVKIFTQKDQTIETQLRLRVYLCNPINNEGIECENDTAKIQSFID